jgi:hypothetical protein
VEHKINREEGEQPPRRPPRPGRDRPRLPRAFDLWLQRRLHDIYDSVVAEPLPDELLRMIDDARPPGGTPAAMQRDDEMELEPA